MTWVTPEEVQQLTGVSLDADDVTRAQAIIDMQSGRPHTAEGDLKFSDQYWLKLATAFQAAYMDAHPEVFQMMEVEFVRQENMDVSFTDDPQDTYLAPLAKKCLRRLSWRGSRSVSVKPHRAEEREEHQWEPLPAHMWR